MMTSAGFFTEPMTMLTDYLIAMECLYFFTVLRRLNVTKPQGSRRWWAWALFFTAVGAFAGGTTHGFSVHLSTGV